MILVRSFRTFTRPLYYPITERTYAPTWLETQFAIRRISVVERAHLRSGVDVLHFVQNRMHLQHNRDGTRTSPVVVSIVSANVTPPITFALRLTTSRCRWSTTIRAPGFLRRRFRVVLSTPAHIDRTNVTPVRVVEKGFPRRLGTLTAIFRRRPRRLTARHQRALRPLFTRYRVPLPFLSNEESQPYEHRYRPNS